MGKRFKLSVDNAQQLVELYFVHAYPDHVFSVKKSETSNSVYITIKYFKNKAVIRLSDHENNKSYNSHIIRHYTTNGDVAHIIERTISNLMKFRLYTFLSSDQNDLKL